MTNPGGSEHAGVQNPLLSPTTVLRLHLPVSYDRVSGVTDNTPGQVAVRTTGADYETFHFVLNNKSSGN